jgi:hypothetical protein
MKIYFLFFSLLIARIVTNALTSSQEESIIGSWSLQLQAFDDNSNVKLDDAERKKANAGRHFYKFNADGTCLIHTMKMKGTYEVKKEGSKTRVYTYIDDQGTKTAKMPGI